MKLGLLHAAGLRTISALIADRTGAPWMVAAAPVLAVHPA